MFHALSESCRPAVDLLMNIKLTYTKLGTEVDRRLISNAWLMY